MVIIGGGRVGTALHARSQEAGVATTLVTRTEGWDALAGPPGEPILLALRNDDMGDVVSRIPAPRKHDLVFVQNGMYRGWLQQRHLQRNTRGLLYFAVRQVGGEVEIGINNPFCGGHAHMLVRWFAMMGLPAEEVDWARFSMYELEKLVWIAAMGVLCEVYDADVGTVCQDHTGEMDGLVHELRIIGRKALGVDVPQAWLMERLAAYSMTIPTYKASVKAWKWRNGWFDLAARRHRYESVVHREMLRSIGKGELLGE